MTYPLVFQYTIPVQGAGFHAVVIMAGRCLVVQDGLLWSVSGIEPGEIGGQHELPQSALQRFREAVENRLKRLAAASADLGDFRGQVEALFAHIDREEELRWDEARRSIREGRTQIVEPFTQLRQEKGDWKSRVKVVDRAMFEIERSKLDGETLAQMAEAA